MYIDMPNGARQKRPQDPLVKLSKSMSFILRHGAEKEGFTLLPGGFLYVDDLLKHRQFTSATEDDIQTIVETNDKKRFSLETEAESGRLKIRANQGHTIEIEDLELTPICDASEYPVVIHGTYHRFYKSIASQGLKRMKRNHIHFAAGAPGENGVISGMRQNCTVVIYINLQKALDDGLQFFISANGVILCPGNADGVLEPKYFDKVVDRETGKRMPVQASCSPSPCKSDQLCEEGAVAAVSAEDIADELDTKRSRRKNKTKSAR